MTSWSSMNCGNSFRRRCNKRGCCWCFHAVTCKWWRSIWGDVTWKAPESCGNKCPFLGMEGRVGLHRWLALVQTLFQDTLKHCRCIKTDKETLGETSIVEGGNIALCQGVFYLGRKHKRLLGRTSGSKYVCTGSSTAGIYDNPTGTADILSEKITQEDISAYPKPRFAHFPLNRTNTGGSSQHQDAPRRAAAVYAVA